jgi:hypothetical protein
MSTGISGAIASYGLKTSSLGDCATKCQRVFLALLPVMDLKPPHLVIALRNANDHFWHCFRGWT